MTFENLYFFNLLMAAGVATAKEKFSKVCSLLHVLYTMTIELNVLFIL